MSMAEADASLTAPGPDVRDGRARGAGHPDPGLEGRAPATLRDVLDLSWGHGEARLPGLRGRADHLRRALPDRRHGGAPAGPSAFGVGPGDRVAIAMRNLPEWITGILGATVCAGAVAVPLNAWWTGDELHYGLADSGATVVLCDQERADRLRPYLGGLTDLRRGGWWPTSTATAGPARLPP